MLQVRNLERHLCRPNGHNRLTTGALMQHDCMTLFNGFYTISLTATGNIAANNNGEGEEETSIIIDWTVENRVDFVPTHMNVVKIIRMEQFSPSI